jgi:hypothetical protein
MGNRLCITIPETWLSEAKYPVIVDPTIGTTTVGSQNEWVQEAGEDPVSLLFELCIPVNRFLVPQTINGACVACVYTNEDDYEAGGRPVLYSDSGNTPRTKKSTLEGLLDLRVTGSNPKGWRGAVFLTNGSIESGSYIWFGVFAEYYWHPRFDYGARCYTDWWWDDGAETAIPNEYPLYNANHYQDFKLSMYLFYTSVQNYVRTLTQGVTPADSRKLAGAYKRAAVQTARGTAVPRRFEGFYRGLVQTVKNTMTMKAAPTLIRKLIQQAGAGDTVKRFLSMLRRPAQKAGVNSGTKRITQTKRAITDTGNSGTATGRKQDAKRYIAHTGNAGAAVLKRAGYVKRFQDKAGSTTHTGTVRKLVVRLIEAVAGLYGMKAASGFGRSIRDNAGIGSAMGGMAAFFRTLFGVAGSGDTTGSFITRMRLIQDTEAARDETGYIADYLRGLFAEAGNMAETTHKGEYYRKQQDTAYSEAVPLRHLFIFLRILTGAYIRDFLLRRFLKSNEELVVKSPVCREIILESTLH